MAVEMNDSGLFTELGDLLGYDPTFYEEPDVSSFPGEDITKHSYHITSPSPKRTYFSNQPTSTIAVPEPAPSSTTPGVDGEIDSLLCEGNMLLDQLMVKNGLSLMTAPVELADVDELISGDAQFTRSPFDTAYPVSELFSQFYEPTSDAYQPDSPLSTLPSEPSSPVDLFDLEAAIPASPQPISAPQLFHSSEHGDSADDLGDLLSSLLDEDNMQEEQSRVVPDFYSSSSQLLCSPAGSACDSDTSDSANGSDLFNDDLDDDDSSSYSCSPKPGKITSPRKKKTSTPYSKLPAKRKEKKKLQNKEAAIRYRQKKKSETQLMAEEESILQERNGTLKAEVLNLEREIMCMKELLSDVFNIHSI